jgi:hypothetical protein
MLCRRGLEKQTTDHAAEPIHPRVLEKHAKAASHAMDFCKSPDSGLFGILFPQLLLLLLVHP